VATAYEQVFGDLKRFITAHDVQILTRRMDVEKPGEFDGPTITINPVHDLEARCYYLAHSFGSICQWSLHIEQARKVFENLRQAKTAGRMGPTFDRAVAAWRQFEQTSSGHAVWTLDEIGHDDVIPPYSVFFRADIEAMTVFHKTGKEPPWPEFFADWKRRVASGEVEVEPFRPKPVPRFRPVRIETQDVLQERD